MVPVEVAQDDRSLERLTRKQRREVAQPSACVKYQYRRPIIDTDSDA